MVFFAQHVVGFEAIKIYLELSNGRYLDSRALWLWALIFCDREIFRIFSELISSASDVICG
jgi:hypothetical protein